MSVNFHPKILITIVCGCIIILCADYVNTQRQPKIPIRTVEDEIVTSTDVPIKTPFTYSNRTSLIVFDMYWHGYIIKVETHSDGSAICDLVRPSKAPIRATEEDFNELIEHQYIQPISLQQGYGTAVNYYYTLAPAGISRATNPSIITQFNSDYSGNH